MPEALLASGDAGEPRGPGEITSPGQAALEYARRFRWAVFACHSIDNSGLCTCDDSACSSPAKHPRSRHGVKDASCSIEVVSSVFQELPDSNVAIAAGKVSGFVVLDVDPRHGGDESLREMEAKFGKLPNSVEVLTGGGGRHLYFAIPREVDIRSRHRLPDFPGLELLSDGCYVIAPPSRHAGGRRYEWEASSIPGDVSLAPIPEWLVSLANTSAPSGEPQSRMIANGSTVVPAGGRHDFLRDRAWALASLRVPAREIRGALTADRDEICASGDHSVSDNELRDLVESAVAKVGQPAVSNDVEFLDLREAWSDEEKEIPWHVPGWVMHGDVCLIAGAGGIGKTTTAADLAAALSLGRPWCGIAVNAPCRVMYFDEEQGSGTTKRLFKKLLDFPPPENLLVASSQGIRVDSDEDAERLRRVIDLHRPAVVFLDSVQQVFGGIDENSATEVGAAYRRLFTLRDTLCATFVLVHHKRKGGAAASGHAEVLELVRGSSAHGTQPSTVWVASSTEPDVLRLTQAKRREAEKTSIGIRYTHDAVEGRIRLVGLEPDDASAMDQAKECVMLLLTGVDEATRSAILECGIKNGHSEPTIDRALEQLCKSNKLTKPRRGLYRFSENERRG